MSRIHNSNVRRCVLNADEAAVMRSRRRNDHLALDGFLWIQANGGYWGSWCLVLPLHEVHVDFEFVTDALLFGQRGLFLR